MELTRGMTKEEMMAMCAEMGWTIYEEIDCVDEDGNTIYECEVEQEDFRGLHGVDVFILNGIVDYLEFVPYN